MGDKDDFSERELKLMGLAWQCFSEQPKVGRQVLSRLASAQDADPPCQINYIKLASLGGYTNPKSVTNAWTAIKKKLAAQAAKSGAGGVGDDAEDSGTPKPKPTPKKRGRKAVDEDDDEETPAKACTAHLQTSTRLMTDSLVYRRLPGAAKARLQRTRIPARTASSRSSRNRKMDFRRLIT